MECVKLGSIYLNGETTPWEIGVVCASDCSFTIGDTAPDPGNVASWVVLDHHRLMALEPVCRNISWKSLNDQGYIKGKRVEIDGVAYTCRIPFVVDDDPSGNPLGINEWKELQDIAGTANEDIHWKNNFFWAQKPGIKGMSGRNLIGFASVNYHNGGTKARNLTFSFRPVLEPVNCYSGNPRDLLNTSVTIMVPDKAIRGTLIEATDYDLSLKLDDSVHGVGSGMSQWALLDIDNIVDIIRDKVCFICPNQK